MTLTAPSFPNTMDDLIVAIAERADAKAFATLFAHFAPRVKGFLMRRGAPAALAEEIAQETLLSVWRKAASFVPGRGNAGTWVFTIARNLSVDRQRRDRNAFPEPDPGDEADPTESAETTMLVAERDKRLHNALATLSPDQHQILNLAFFQDKPHQEVAASLGIPLGTVKSRIRLAVARLRLLLDDPS